MFFLKINNPEGSGTIIAAATAFNMYASCSTCGMPVKLSKRDVIEDHEIWNDYYECPFCRKVRKEIMDDFTGNTDIGRDAEAVCRSYDDVDPFADDDDKQADDDDICPECRERMKKTGHAPLSDEEHSPSHK